MVNHFHGSHPLLGAVERAGHRLLESVGQCGTIRNSARFFCAGGAPGRSQRQSDLRRPGGPYTRIYAARSGHLQVRVRNRCVRLSHVSRLRTESQSGIDGLRGLSERIAARLARSGHALSRNQARTFRSLMTSSIPFLRGSARMNRCRRNMFRGA